MTRFFLLCNSVFCLPDQCLISSYQSSHAFKALFDVKSRLYVTTDALMGRPWMLARTASVATNLCAHAECIHITIHNILWPPVPVVQPTWRAVSPFPCKSIFTYRIRCLCHQWPPFEPPTPSRPILPLFLTYISAEMMPTSPRSASDSLRIFIVVVSVELCLH